MKLTSKQMQILLDLAHDLEARMRFNYSGRGMMGAECVALISNLSPARMAMEVAVALYRNDETLLVDSMTECVKTDNMGKDEMIYFPGITA